MGMEAVKGAAMTYQGSASAVTKEESQPKAVLNENPTATAVPAATANRMVVAEGADQNSKGSAGQQPSDQKNTQLKKAVEEINKKMLHNSEAVFGIHEGTNRVTIKIVDKESKKVLKEIPPEETLDMIAKVWELAGIMVDEKR